MGVQAATTEAGYCGSPPPHRGARFSVRAISIAVRHCGGSGAHPSAAVVQSMCARGVGSHGGR
eukprot:5389126-Alexandrium_andersonii.AAC.1